MDKDDYRYDQSRKDWWDERIPWLGGITRNDWVFICVGIILAALYIKFPVNWDWVFGLRP